MYDTRVLKGAAAIDRPLDALYRPGALLGFGCVEESDTGEADRWYDCRLSVVGLSVRIAWKR